MKRRRRNGLSYFRRIVMPDMNDFHAFKSTSGGDDGGSNGGG